MNQWGVTFCRPFSNLHIAEGDAIDEWEVTFCRPFSNLHMAGGCAIDEWEAPFVAHSQFYTA